MASVIYTSAFAYCARLLSLYLMGSSVCTLNAGAFTGTPIRASSNYPGSSSYGSIYVPSSLYNTYSTATNWVTYSARMVSI